MPKTALISDIHGNIDALESALADIDQQGITELLCLGDIVGYGAAPAECLRLVRERCSIILMGNHEAYTLLELEGLNLSARVLSGIRHTQNQITPEDVVWIRNLPLSSKLHGFTIVHASLDRPETFGYLLDDPEANAHFPQQETPVCFYGHTHKPAIALQYTDKIRWGIPGEGELLLDLSKKCAINVGSVGQPRDGSSRVTYGVYDTGATSFTLRRVSYDIQKAAQRILDVGLPEENAERLFDGM